MGFRRSSPALSYLLAVLLLAGCTSADITEHQPYQGEKLRIIVYDFTADPADVPANSPFAAQFAGVPRPTPEQIELGHRLGAQVAQDPVADLQGKGPPAVSAVGQAPPRVNDIVLRGYFVDVDEGSAGKRILVGFGSGEAKLTTAVERYQMTAQGLRPLGRGEVRSGGGEMPGMVAPLAMVAATANPVGLIVGGAVKATGEMTGSDTIEGAAKRTPDAIAAQLKQAAQEQAWI